MKIRKIMAAGAATIVIVGTAGAFAHASGVLGNSQYSWNWGSSTSPYSSFYDRVAPPQTDIRTGGVVAVQNSRGAGQTAYVSYPALSHLGTPYFEIHSANVTNGRY